MSRPLVLRVRFALATAFLAAWAGSYALDSVWYGDFWSHAAVIRELAVHLTSPGHPQLAVDASHAFFSPYAWIWAAVSRGAGLDAFGTLGLAGVVNALLLGLAVLLGCRTWFGRRGLATAFWALVLILFWWGDGEWFWSGFLHAGVFGYVASYPSTFALIASLFAFALLPGWLDGSIARGIGVILLLTSVLLAHPVTAVFTIVGMAAMGLERWPERRAIGAIPLAVGLAVGLAAVWPLYPFLDLFVTENQEFHTRSLDLYEHVWPRAYPAILALPIVLRRLGPHRRDAVAWSILGLLAVYAIGFATGWYGLGRVLSPAAILVQIGLAREIVGWEERLPTPRAAAVYAAIVLVAAWMVSKADGPLGDVFRIRENGLARFEILAAVPADDVVLADLATSWHLPAFGAKVVASEKPLYWVPDHATRRRDVQRFFEPATADAERRSIVSRYAVRYVLLDANTSWEAPRWLRPAAHDDAWILFEVDPATREAGPPGGEADDSAILDRPQR